MLQRLIGNLIKRGSLTIRFADGTVETYGRGKPNHVVRFTDRRVPVELMLNARLAIAETYMDGRLVVENGTILDILETFIGANPWEQGGKRGRTGLSKSRWLEVAKSFRRNPLRRARRNVAHHYDLDDRLYDLFLDPLRQYSCGYFTDPANSLEQAQRDKLAHIAAKLALAPGQHVLDIGCGWGGLAIYLAKVCKVRVTGITLSTEQLAYARDWAAREGLADTVRFELVDYREARGTYDRIVSVGMFEHVGAAHYDEFYARCRDLLADDGVMLLHTIGKLGGPGSPDPFTDKWIFPGYHLPSVSQMAPAAEAARLMQADIEMLRVHYGMTLRHWLARCAARRAEIVALYDERFYRMWEFYLSGGIVMFESGAACNYQLQYVKDRRAVPLTRDYMAADEARYRTLGDALFGAPARKARATAPATAKVKTPAKGPAKGKAPAAAKAPAETKAKTKARAAAKTPARARAKAAPGRAR